MENIFWTGYSNNERHASISTIENVVSKYGDIVDFKFFSDISLTMAIEIEEFKIDKLYNELANTIRIDKFENLNSVSKKERKVYLNITFTKGTGNLTIEVPNVPGWECEARKSADILKPIYFQLIAPFAFLIGGLIIYNTLWCKSETRYWNEKTL